MTLVQRAASFAKQAHAGQRRKTGELYSEHPRRVVAALRQHGMTNKQVLAIAWLHDVLEDTTVTYEQLLAEFGKDIADGVHALSRNVDDDAYKQRLLLQDKRTILIKLFDLLDNLRTLNVLSPTSRQRKVHDTNTFYILLAERLAPQLVPELRLNASSYKA